MAVSSASISYNALIAAYGEARQQGSLDRYRKRRWQRSGEFREWLSEGELPALSNEQALALYRASGGNRTKDFAANSIAEIRDTLDFLLYDTITLEARFNECVSDAGAYTLGAAGKGFVSYLLCLSNPNLFAVWNPAAERALRYLGLYPRTLARGHLGLRYLDLLDAMQRVRRQFGLEGYPELDQFCYFISRYSRTGA